MVPGGRRLHRPHPQNAFKEVEAEEAVENGGQVHPPLGQRPRPDHSLRHGLPGHPGEDRGDGPPPPPSPYMAPYHYFLSP